MIAKVVRSRKSRSMAFTEPANIQTSIAYICRKACFVVTEQLAGYWPHAALQMETAASLAPRCTRPIYHIVLSWAAPERPSSGDMVAAARMMLHHLGARAHQAVIALHDDRPHPHLHILLNRIHPISGRRLRLSHDYARLEHGCRRIEHQFGWPPDRGRYDGMLRDDQITLVPKPAAHWQRKASLRAQGIRPDSVAVRGPEIRTGWPALRDAIAPTAFARLRQVIEKASNWQAVHDALRPFALRYAPCRTGARMIHERVVWGMPACHLGSACSLPRMERRIGPYQSDRSQVTKVQGQLPLAPFVAELSPQLRILTQTLQARQRHRMSRAALGRGIAREREMLRRHLGRSLHAFARALRAVAKEQHRQTLQLWDGMHPAPTEPDQTIAKIADILRDRHRYRTLHRGQPLKDADGRYADHTALRQAWDLARTLDLSTMQAPLSDILGENAHAIRYDGTDHLIIALRSDEDGITGFCALCLQTGQSQHYGNGIAVLGPDDAPAAFVTSDPQEAIEALARPDRPQIMLMPEAPGTHSLTTLAKRLAGKNITMAPELRRSAIADELHGIFPHGP